MKQMFNNVFKDPTKMQELWTANSSYFTKFDEIETMQDVINLANSNVLIDLLNFIR